jgi:hypothetical protein
MTPHDQQRFADLVSAFIDGCGSNGSVSVSLHTRRDVEQICGHEPSRMTAPITLTVVQAEDGRGSSAKIEIVAARPTMQ